MMMMRRTIALLSLALVMAGCVSRKPIQQPPQGVQTQPIQATPRANGDGLRFSALVMPDSQVPLAFRISGYVVSLKQVRGQNGRLRDLAEGDHVNRGELLLRIRAAEYQDQVQQASSQVDAAEAAALKAKLDYERASRLYESESITKPEFDAARAQYDATQAEVKAAQAKTSEARVALHDTSLVAPFSGDVVKKSVELGAFVGPGVPAFSIAKTDQVKIVVGVPDTVVRSLKLGQPVAVSVDAFPGRTFSARITRMASAADPVTRNFEVEVGIPNRDQKLKVGMIGSLQLLAGDQARQQPALMVPLSSIVQSSSGKYGVFTVSKSDSGNIARLRPVSVGDVEGTDIRVTSGLTVGETVVTNGATLLKDGERVEILK